MQHLQKTGGGGPPPFDVQTFRRADQGPIYPLYFLHLTALLSQRTLLNPSGINPLRTLFIATEGVPLSLAFRRSDRKLHRNYGEDPDPVPTFILGLEAAVRLLFVPALLGIFFVYPAVSV